MDDKVAPRHRPRWIPELNPVKWFQYEEKVFVGLVLGNEFAIRLEHQRRPNPELTGVVSNNGLYTRVDIELKPLPWTLVLMVFTLGLGIANGLLIAPLLNFSVKDLLWLLFVMPHFLIYLLFRHVYAGECKSACKMLSASWQAWKEDHSQ